MVDTELQKKGEYYLKHSKPGIALKYFIKLLEFNPSKIPSYSHLYYSYKTAHCYYEMDNFSMSIKIIRKNLLRLKYLKNPQRNKLGFDFHRLLGLVFKSRGEYSEAINCFLNAKKLIQQGKEFSYLHVAELNNDLAFLYSKCNEYNLAASMYLNSVKLIESNKDKNNYLLGSVYNNLGTLVNKASRVYEEDLSDNINSPLIYYKKAIFLFTKSKNPLSVLYLAITYNNLSFYYLKKGDKNLQLKYLVKSMSTLSIAPGDNRFYLSNIFLNLGNYYSCINNFGKSIFYLKKSLSIRKKIMDLDSSHFIKNYQYIGDSYSSNGKHLLSLKHYQKALNLVLAGKHFDENVNYLPELIDIISSKANVQKLLYNKTFNLKYLKESFKDSVLLSNLFNKIRVNLSTEESKRILATRVKSLSELSIHLALMSLERIEKKQYFFSAFEFNEKCKSLLLLENILESDARSSGIIPKKILSKENHLKIEISSLEKEIFEEKRKPKTNKNKLSGLEGRLFELKESLNDLMDKIKKKHKEYYDLKYNVETASISQVQSVLKNDALLIEYFIGQEYIFVFTVSKKDFNVKKIKINKSFDKRIKKYRSAFSNIAANHAKDFKLFANTGYYLYKLLLKDVFSEYNDIKSVVIIPDGSLNFIPFETLLTQKPQPKDNFKSLNYLIEIYDISYSYSATLFCRNSLKTIKTNKSNKILSFAPTFSASNPVREDALRSGLESLKWNKKEASLPAKYFDSRSYKGKYATKKNFLENASKYSILHLATHGIAEDSNPMFSKIAFAPNNKSVDEGYLHAYELYNMKLNTKLAILSACETGYGKLVKGEGVMSIARGFLFAGSRSIMMSLWQVSDYATYKIVNYFYKGLSEGLNKDEALRQAKLKYIKSSDKIKSNPAYWAPFVLIGDTRPL